MEDLGGIQWELLGTLTLGWIIVYFMIWKGLHASGKVCDTNHLRHRLKPSTYISFYYTTVQFKEGHFTHKKKLDLYFMIWKVLHASEKV